MKPLAPIGMAGIGLTAFAQTTSTGTASTKGACSPANTGNRNTFNITCGIGKEQGTQLIKIVNKILANQTDLKEFGNKLDAILRGVNDIKEANLPIRIDDRQRPSLIAALSPFKEQKITVQRVSGDHLGGQTAEDLVGILAQSGWIDPSGAPIKEASIGFFSKDPVGIVIEVNDKDADANAIPPGANALIRSLSAIVPSVKGFNNARVPQGGIWLIIGLKQ